MKRRKVSVPFILGVLLILCSLCMVLIFRVRVEAGARESQKVVSQIDRLLPERSQGSPGLYQNTDMPVLQINGTDYLGILDVPAFGIRLPVACEWDTERLYSTPCRFCGSVYNHTLVLGGSDYSQQFSFCDKIEVGTLVMITDMTGAQFSYRVSSVDRSEHAQAIWLLDEDSDLVLFCRDLYSGTYIAVRCVSSVG